MIEGPPGQPWLTTVNDWKLVAEAWAADGVTVADPAASPVEEPVGLLLLEESVDGVETASYRIAFNNFYVLTRYNRSRLYATAVFELAKAVRIARGDAPRSTPRSTSSEGDR